MRRHSYVSTRVLSPHLAVRTAGDASTPSSVPQGTQWAGVAFVAGMFGLFYWGLRKESPEEIAAYQQMRMRKQFAHSRAA